MGIEPFFRGQVTYNESDAALNLGILYRGLSSKINVPLLSNSAYFAFDTTSGKELIHVGYTFTASGPGLITLYADSPTTDITNFGDAIPVHNQRSDIQTPSPILVFENTIVAEPGTKIINQFQIGVLGNNSGQSEGGAIALQKGILKPPDAMLFRFQPDFDDTDCRFYITFFEKDPLFT